MMKFDASGEDLISKRWFGSLMKSGLGCGLTALASIMLFQSAADAKTIYVNASNPISGNGTSWAKSFTFLQDALKVAIAGDKIFLAKGTYYPDDFLPINGENLNYGDRELSFELNRVTIYGGFLGNETNIDQRDPAANETILSGAIWDAVTNPGYERYWALHVVVLKGDSTLDGVTIQHGRANGDEPPYNQGGAVYAPSGTTVTFENCLLRENLACESGGAVWGTVKANKTTFSDNRTDNEFLLTDKKLTDPNAINRSWLFNENCFGGAINGDVTAKECQFLGNIVNTRSLNLGNTTSASGGAINGTNIVLDQCLFDGNSAVAYSKTLPTQMSGSTATSIGGAIVGYVKAKNCKFLDNSALATSECDRTSPRDDKHPAVPYIAAPTAHGGAISGRMEIVNCFFAENTAYCTSQGSFLTGDKANSECYGGAVYVEGISNLTNNVLSANHTGYTDDTEQDPYSVNSALGGAVFASSTSEVPIANCTLIDNVSDGTGTALYVNGNVKILSNIFWDTGVNSPFSTIIALPLAEGNSNAKARISNRLYPTPSTETINIVTGGYDNIDAAGSNADFGDPPERTLLDPVTPVFVDDTDPLGVDGEWGTQDDGIRLADASVAIGIGHKLFIPKDTLDVDDDGNVTENLPVDVAGYSRLQNGTLDLGAYEFGDILDQADIVVEFPSGNSLTDGVSVVDFGAAPGSPLTKTFTIRNTGVGNLSGLAVSMSGTDVADFTFTQPAVTNLNSGASTTFKVTFKPLVAGERTAAIHIASNDPDEDPFDIDVRGDALVPDIAVEQPFGTNLTDGVSTINYGQVSPLASESKTFTIRNTGEAKLNILSLTTSGAAASEFTITGPVQKALVPGEFVAFKVAFTPSTSGTRNATLTIASDDPDAESSFTIKLTGTGVVSPEIGVAQPAKVDLTDGDTKSFGNVKTDLAYTKEFTIKNEGSAKLKNLSVSLKGSSTYTKTKLAVDSLKPGEKTKFTVTFKPKSAGEKTATLKISSNDANENPFTIYLKGTGYNGSAPSAKSALVAAATSSADVEIGSSGGAVTVIKQDDGLEYLVLTVQKTPGWSAAKHTTEVSSNLVDWFSGDKHTTTLIDNATILRVRDNTPVQKGEKRYIRLK